VQLLQAVAENPWVCIQHLDLASNSLPGTTDAFMSELHWHLPVQQACVRVLAFASAHVWPSMSGYNTVALACCPPCAWVVPWPRPCKLQAVWRWANSSRFFALFIWGCGAAGLQGSSLEIIAHRFCLWWDWTSLTTLWTWALLRLC
jgi:hypothetical protein